jgi:hypothetical protein
MRPVDAHMCLYESLLNGNVDLADIARMNDYLDIKMENTARVHAANAPDAGAAGRR